MWYCAHALHYFEYEDERQENYLVWEHMYLIQATSAMEAMKKGELHAKNIANYSEGSGLKVNDRSARLRFVTIRKVVECQDLDDKSGMPTDGTELSYLEYIVPNKNEFEKLIHGKKVIITYIGHENEEDDSETI